MAENELLVPQETYLKSGIHIGTKFRTKHMEKFIYKTRPDGLSVLNLQLIDERIKQAIEMLKQFEPDEILIVSRRENGWKPVKMFNKVTGIKTFAGRYPPGSMTNPALKTYFEKKILVVTDAWPDRNAIRDAVVLGLPVIALSDTNNLANNVDLILPCNNKGKKSLGLIFWVFAKEYMKAKNMIKNDAEFTYTIDDFTED